MMNTAIRAKHYDHHFYSLAVPPQYAEQGLCKCWTSICLSHLAATCRCCRCVAVSLPGKRYQSTASLSVDWQSVVVGCRQCNVVS